MPVPAGEEGRILITNLHNYAMPLIRYDIGDMGLSSDAACRCGRGLPLLAGISGRVADVIFTPDGKTIPGIALPFSVFNSPVVQQFQIVQEELEKVVVRIVTYNDNLPQQVDDVVTGIVAQFRTLFGNDMDISVELVDRISPTPSGKRRFIISNLPHVS